MAEVKTVVTAVTKPIVEKTKNLKETAQEAEKKVDKKAVAKVDTTKATVKKEVKAVKKTATNTAKKAVKKAEVSKEKAAKAIKNVKAKIDLHIQIQGKSYDEEKLVKIAKDVWVFDMNKLEKDFKSVSLYIKPEEMKVYFVVNGTEEGSFTI